MTSFPQVSVVIPTLNAAGRLPAVLSALASQRLSPCEVLVVDSSSEDGTAEVAAAFPGVQVRSVERASFNHGATRHEALLRTRGDFVCFLTDDAVPVDEFLLEKLAAPFADPEVAMATARQVPRPDARRFEQLVRGFNYPPVSNVRSRADVPTLGIKTFFASDSCSMYRRDAYLEVGGFGRVDTNEDMLIAAAFIAAGLKVAYAADARVVHSHSFTLAEQYRRNFAVGRFLEEHAERLAGAGEVGEGARLVRSVAGTLLREGAILELAAFGLDCAARFLGNRAGRRQARRSQRS